MKKYTTGVCIVISLLFACNNPKDKTGNAPAAVQKNFFPVADFIKSEIREVDSLPIAIIKYDLNSKNRDSVFIKPVEFDLLAQDFLPAIFTNGDFEKDYTESSFMDESTKSVVFTYSTKNNKQEIQRIDVLAKPEQSSEQVKSVYMEKITNVSDTLKIKKLYWGARNYFQVVSSIQVPGQKPVTTQYKVRWGISE